MVCRLEKQRKNLGDIKASTVFDKMFSDSYYSRRQQCVPSEKTEQSDSLRDVTSTKITSVAGTINYMAPGGLKKNGINVDLFVRIHYSSTGFYLHCYIAFITTFFLTLFS